MLQQATNNYILLSHHSPVPAHSPVPPFSRPTNGYLQHCLQVDKLFCYLQLQTATSILNDPNKMTKKWNWVEYMLF